eukprot:Phypoly_transcript_06440.p1 GENE.Phypoly_transcript_06440~~Phypoly_transcript_06440.p1  ORF type:complete len:377 (+),score=66.58 Phypoly_transcript_06440:592-1722(+)
MRACTLLALFLFISSFILYANGQGAFIADAVRHGRKTYVFDGCLTPVFFPEFAHAHAFEIEDNKIVKTFDLAVPNNTITFPGSTWKHEGKLYQFVTNETDGFFVEYEFPFTTNPVIPIRVLHLPAALVLAQSIFNAKDGIAIGLVQHNLTTINITSFDILDNDYGSVGHVSIPNSLTYNHKTRQAYLFQLDECGYYTGFCLQTLRFNIKKNGKIGFPQYPLQHVNFSNTLNYGEISGCQVDASTQDVWCLWAQNWTLIRFPVAHFRKYEFVPLSFPGDNGFFQDGTIDYDFKSGLAYLGVRRDHGFGVRIVKLENGHVVEDVHFNGYNNNVLSVTLTNAEAREVVVGLDLTGVNGFPQGAFVDMVAKTATNLTITW